MPFNRDGHMGGKDGLIGDDLLGSEGYARHVHGLCQARPQVAVFHHESHRTTTEIFIAKLHHKGRRHFAGGAIADFYFNHGLCVRGQIVP